MKKSATKFYLLMMISPAVISLFPLEIVGVSGNILQRLPVLLSNGVPYLDLAVLPVLFFALVTLARGQGDFLGRLFVFPQIVMSFLWWLFPQDLSLNQSFGLFLGVVSISAYVVSQRFVSVDDYRRTLQRLLFFQTIFGVLLALFLVLHVYSLFSYATNLLVTIDRFEGESFRMRWEAVRGVEKMAASASVSWAMYRVVSQRQFAYLLVPIVFAVQQIAVSSRGGVLLVIFAAVVPIFIFPPLEKRRSAARKGVYLLLSALIVAGGAGVILGTESGMALVRNVGEFSDDESIRSRMKYSALLLFMKAPVFGNGYFDLFSTPEWSPFLLENMLLPIHNVFLHYLVHFGVVGTFFFSAVVLAIGIDFLKLRSKYRLVMTMSAGRMSEVVGVSFSVYVAGLYMIVFQTLDRVGSLYLWCFCGLAAASLVAVKKSQAKNSSF